VIYTGGVAGLDNPTLQTGAVIAGKYLNASGGGIAGRPVEIVSCNDKGDPAVDATCAQKFVDAGVVAVTGLGPAWGDNGLPITGAAGIPFVGLPISNAEFIDPSSYPITGGSAAAFPALAQYFINKKVKTASILYADLAAGKLAADALLGDPMKAAGITVTEVPEKVGAPDFTASVVKATEGDPDVLFILFGSVDCARIAQAASQVGVKSALAGAGSCAEDAKFSKVDKSIVEGAVFNSDTVWYQPKDKQTKVYLSALKKYAKGEQPSSFSATTFATVLTLKTIGDGLGANLSAATILDALKNASGIPVFMATELNKDEPALLAGIPTHIYNTDQRIIKLKNGKFVDANNNQWISGFK
jgi:branched-chain amino acid transport system substrate-binding protein